MDYQSTPTKTYKAKVQIKQPDLSIILVCWNNKSYLEPCLESLYHPGLQCAFDVVVVDNGSTDGSQEMLREKYPQVRIIQNAENLGLGKASNQGIEVTKGRYILLLNNDTLVNGASFDAMVKFLDDHPQAAGVGGRLLNPDGSPQSFYNHFSTLGEEFLIASRLGESMRPWYPTITHGEEMKSVDWIGSACLMLRREALDQVGLLDENYFIYGDEADLQYRLKQAGWEIYFLPSAHTIHYGGRSMNRWSRRKLVYRGKIRFYQKHYGGFKTAALRVMLVILSLLKMIPWGISIIIPKWRERAGKELRSNWDVLNVCINPTK
jgi:GT2 family glycosyltransferase